MNKNIGFPFAILIAFCSCRIQPGSNRNYAGDNKVYKLRLNPPNGARYDYHITNESKYEVEVNDKQIGNIKRTEVTIDYGVSKDSLGNILLSATYEKAHLYIKNGDDVTEEDASNAVTSTDPVEKALGALLDAHITATVDRTGKVKAIAGIKETASRMLSGVDASDQKQKAEARLEEMVGQGLVKGNMEQLFKIFPDSAVHIGDKWKLLTTEKNEINFAIKSSYLLKSIEDGIATIESTGEISSDTTSNTLMGSEVKTDLKGQEQGTYTMDITTGMLLRHRSTIEISGTIQMVGREIPIKMEMNASVDGQKK